jgi:hypothetical protein
VIFHTVFIFVSTCQYKYVYWCNLNTLWRSLHAVTHSLCLKFTHYSIYTMVLVVSNRPLNAKPQIQSDASPCGICDKQSSIGTCFSPSTSVLPCRFHSPTVAYLLIHLPQMLYNLSEWQRHWITHFSAVYKAHSKFQKCKVRWIQNNELEGMWKEVIIA